MFQVKYSPKLLLWYSKKGEAGSLEFTMFLSIRNQHFNQPGCVCTGKPGCCMPGLRHRENHSGTESHYLLTHLESVISYMLFCYLAAE